TNDAGTYDVIVSNACGTVTSNTASLAINRTGNVGAVIVDAQSPNPVTIGSSATYLITVTRGVGSSGSFDATLSVTTSLPAGLNASFVPASLNFGNGGGNNTKTSTLTLTITTTG